MKQKNPKSNAKEMSTVGTLGVVFTGLMFGNQAKAGDPNEWERWDQNTGNKQNNVDLPNIGGSNPNDGTNNQSDPKIGGNFDDTTSSSSSSTASTLTEWVIFGAYAQGADSDRFTIDGTLSFSENNGTAYGGSVELDLQDDDHSRSTKVSSSSINVNLDGASSQTFYGGREIGPSPTGDFSIVGAGGSELLNLNRRFDSNDFSPSGRDTACGAGCTTVAAYGTFTGGVGGQVLQDTFFTTPEREASTDNFPRINFVTGQATPASAIAALSGVANADYAGVTSVYGDTVNMKVNFTASTFTGSVTDVAFTRIDLTVGGTLSGASFNATSIMASDGEMGTVQAGSVFDGSLVGPTAQGAIGRIDVDATVEATTVNYNDVFAIGHDN